MNAIIDAAISHARTVIGTLVLVLIAGTVAYVEIPKEADPDINIPILYVSIVHEGISPEDAERLLIRPMEKELRSVEGVKDMRGKGFEGGANLVMEFDAGFDAAKALSDVRAKVDLAKAELPAETEEPTVHEVNFSLFPVLVVTLAGEVPERTLFRLARDLKDKVQGLNSVLSAEIAGNREEQIEVLIDPMKVESYGLSPTETVAAVKKSNLLVAAGAQDTGLGRFSVKVPGLFETVEDILKMPIKVSGDAAIVVGDLAEVRRNYKDPVGFARVGARPAIAIEVSKRTGHNVIETIEKVRATVEAERRAWPETLRNAVQVGYSQDKSDVIRTMLLDLQNNVISAVLLVMIVVVAALGLRSAGLVGVAIPGSFLAAMLTLSLIGFTVNIVVLFSLILAVGMLVDGAIVVTEYADRKMAEGLHRREAYGLAAKRMAWPIVASTATTLAAFLPLVFWPGVVGEFMKFLPITLLITLTASLFMALIFVPTLGAYFGKAGAADPATMKSLAAGETGSIADIGGVSGAYVRGLQRVLRHPLKIVLGAAVLLVGVQVVYGAVGKGVEFFPDVEPDFAKPQVRARGNLSTLEKHALMREVENRIGDMREFKTLYVRTGQEERSEEAEDIIGTVTLEFADWRHRRKANAILADIEMRVADLAGIAVDRRKQEAGPPVGKAVQIQLSSRQPDLLAAAAAKVTAKFHALGGLTNIEDGRPLPGIDWVLTVDRAQAAKFGADIDSIGQAIQMATTGIKLGEYRPDDADEEVDIRVRYPVPYRTIAELDRIRLATPDGNVPLSNFVVREAKPKVGTINRVNAKRAMTVKADVLPGVLPDDKVRELHAWIDKEAKLDPRIDVRFKGQDEEQKKAEAFLGKAFGVALFIMAIILVTQFNSFYSAFLILSAVIMSTVGVFIGLLVTQQPFGVVMGGIGVVALAGIVVNNNIILIDTYDRLAETSATPLEAILRTGAQRLRPVLLTTVTTILGLLPMTLGMTIDFVERTVEIGAPSTQWWRQLSTAIVFGLGFSTVLTLVFTPCMLMLRANFRDWRRRRGRKAQALGGSSAEFAASSGAGSTSP